LLLQASFSTPLVSVYLDIKNGQASFEATVKPIRDAGWACGNERLFCIQLNDNMPIWMDAFPTHFFFDRFILTISGTSKKSNINGLCQRLIIIARLRSIFNRTENLLSNIRQDVAGLADGGELFWKNALLCDRFGRTAARRICTKPRNAHHGDG
jgi:hypothetical protein